MTVDWQLTYEIHYTIFGVAFALLTAWCLSVLIHARNSLSTTKYRLCYSMNGALVIFNINQALMLLLHRYLSDEVAAALLAFDKFLFKLGFPCLIAGYVCIPYPCFDYLNDRTRFVFNLLVLQCCLFIISDIVETGLSYGEQFERLVLFINIIISVVSLIYAIFCSIRHDDYCESTKKMDNLPGLAIDIKEDENPTLSSAKNKIHGTTRQPVLALGISCISVACVVIRSCIFTNGNLKSWNNADIDMENWYSWIYANVFRGVELGNVAAMSYLVHHITLKQGTCCKKRSSIKTFPVNA